jgi:hypothetical protein
MLTGRESNLTEGLDENDLTERLGPKRNMINQGKGEALGQDFRLPRGFKKPAVGKHLLKERCRIVRATLNYFPKLKGTFYFFLVRTLFDLIILFLS